ncbi:MAG: hypothetical protein ACK5O7_05885 [Holosporales bacterium]
MSKRSFVIRPSRKFINANRVILFLFTFLQCSILFGMAYLSMGREVYLGLKLGPSLFFFTFVSLFVIHWVDRVATREGETITMESGRVFQRSQKRTRLKIFWFTALPLMIFNPWLALGIALLAYRSYDIYHDITPSAFDEITIHNAGSRRLSASMLNGTLHVIPENPRFSRSIFK